MSHNQNPFLPGAPKGPTQPTPVSPVPIIVEEKAPRVFSIEERVANIENAVHSLHGWMLGLVERGELTTYSKEISDLRAIVADFNMNRPT